MSGTVRLWRWAAVAACAVIALAAFGWPDPNSRLRSALAIHDFGHVAAFGLVTGLLAFALNVQSCTGSRERARIICLAAIAALVLGATVELAQAASGLNGDPWDVVRDGGGALLVALILIALGPAISGNARAALSSISLVILAGFSYPVFAALYEEAKARAQFPVLASFETTRELSRFRFLDGERPEIVSIRDNNGRLVSAIRLRLPPGRYPGFALKHFPGDWRDLRALELLIVNPETTPLNLTIRIDDAEYDYKLDLVDRYNRSFPLSAGLNRIEIPLSDVATAPRGRRFDLGRVQLLLAYAIDLERPREIIVGPITLLR